MAGGALALRFSGLAFRAWVCVQVGARGMGLYQLLMSVFALAVTASASGMNLAVTRVIAEGRGGRREVRRCALFALTLSVAAGSALWLGADFLGAQVLHSAEAAAPLRLLAPGLPCMALCACLKGYFLAERNTILPAISELLEQGATIGACVLLFARMPPLEALCLGNTLGEGVACAFVAVSYLLFARHRHLKKQGGATPKMLAHIAAPVLCGAITRSGLSSAENLLVPRGLRLHGDGPNAALAQYGVVQAMVMPLLYLPSSLLMAAASLLIPELAELRACGNKRSIQRVAERAVQATLWFSFLTASVFIVFAGPIGLRFYSSTQAGTVLRVLAPIVPLLYLDSVVDGMLKGLDQQLYSLRYNLLDSLLRVGMAALLLPAFGIKAYLFLLFFSEIFNATLSVNRLLKVTELRADVTWVLSPAVAAALLYYLLELLLKYA